MNPARKAAKSAPRVNVYVDGFNLYYGALKGTPYKWLDLDALFRRLLPDYELHRIRYFTARVKPRPDNGDAPKRQNTYLRALATLPSVAVHFGSFLVSITAMPLADPPGSGSPLVRVVKTEEKGSDVNLATYLVIDAIRGDCEVAVVVSNDSDLCEPIRIVNDEIGVPVIIFNPHTRTSVELKKLIAPRPVRKLRKGPLAASQFPAKVRVANGRSITKPADW